MRVTRLEIKETTVQLEDPYRSWKKDIVYLEDIGAYDFKDQTVASILMYFVPDESHREMSMKRDTAGKKASSMRTRELMDQRETDTAESREQERQEEVR